MPGYVTLTCADPRCVDPTAGPLHRIDMHPALDRAEVLERAGWIERGGRLYCARHRHTIPTPRAGDHGDAR